jgi:uncharacterized protein (DUF1778 family)
MAGMVRNTNMVFRVTEEEKEAIERAARKEKMNVSDWLRKVVMVEHMMEWDHRAMMAVRNKVEADIRAALEEHFEALERVTKKRA